MRKGILALILGSLILASAASATTPVPLVPFDTWAGLVAGLIFTNTPAFATGWGNATAIAYAIDPETGFNKSGELQPYTVSAVIISPETEAVNMHKDPCAALNMTVQSVAALAGADGLIPVNAGTPGEFNASAYAAAIGTANLDATGIHEANTIAAFNTTAIVTPIESDSFVNGNAFAVADLVI